MPIVQTDLTLIIDGILRRDDSDRIGQITRAVQAFSLIEGNLNTETLALVQAVQQTITDAVHDLQQTLTQQFTQMQATVDDARRHAAQLATDLEHLLSSTPPGVITQAQLDALGEQVEDLQQAASAVQQRTEAL